MPAHHEFALALDSIHFYLKNHMTIHVLVSHWRILTIIQQFEGNSYITHLLGNCILPESIAILFINLSCPHNSLGNFQPKLVCALMILLVHSGNNPVPLLKDVWCPPGKGQFMVNTFLHCISASSTG